MKFVTEAGVAVMLAMGSVTMFSLITIEKQNEQLLEAKLTELQDLTKIVKDSNTVIKSLVEVNRNVRETLNVAQEIEPKYEKRVLENLKKDYGCPNENFNDFCMSLENYEHNRHRF